MTIPKSHNFSIITLEKKPYLEATEPLGLVVVLCGGDAGVEEYQSHNQPEHCLGLDSPSALGPDPPVDCIHLFHELTAAALLLLSVGHFGHDLLSPVVLQRITSTLCSQYDGMFRQSI